MANRRSRVTLFRRSVQQLTEAQTAALEKTVEALHTEVQQARVMPRKMGTLQGDATFEDKTNAKDGKVMLVTNTYYARRLYYHPEYNFNRVSWDERVYGKRGKNKKNGGEYKGKLVHHEGNANAKGRWLEDWMPGGRKENFVQETFAENLRREMRRQGGGENR